jgi:hypothetical protein
MLELLPVWILVVGLIVAWRLYLHAFRELDRAAGDPVGPVVLSRAERTAIRNLERQFMRAAGGQLVGPSKNL